MRATHTLAHTEQDKNKIYCVIFRLDIHMMMDDSLDRQSLHCQRRLEVLNPGFVGSAAGCRRCATSAAATVAVASSSSGIVSIISVVAPLPQPFPELDGHLSGCLELRGRHAAVLRC